MVAVTCSNCGLCDTYYVAHVKDACAFLGDGMSRVEVGNISPTTIVPLVALLVDTTGMNDFGNKALPEVPKEGNAPDN